MSKYDDVTMKEYMEKKLEMLNDLGRNQNCNNFCIGVVCYDCPLNEEYNGYDCSALELMYQEKAIEIVMNYEPKVNIDWSNVPIDTKVLVRNYNCEKWVNGHFAKYKDGKIYTYPNGVNSFNHDAYNNCLVGWKYGKLYKEKNNEE